MFRKSISFLSGKIGISLIASFVIVVSAFVLKDAEFLKGSPRDGAALATERDATKQVFEKDTDGDGLKDWEESLYGTDINNPDTKGNGLGDAEEVKKAQLEAGTSTTGEAGAGKTLSATDRFSRELFSKYLEAKQSGNDITAELTEQIANDVLTKSYETEIVPFDESVLVTVATSDPTFIRSYGNAVGLLVSAPLPEGVSNELLILEQITARESTSEKNTSDLNKLVSRYTKMRDGLVALKVPEDSIDAHAQLIQGIELVTAAVEGIQSLDSDPISSLPKISRYEDGLNLLGAASLRLSQYFISKNISFSPYESGSVFMQ